MNFLLSWLTRPPRALQQAQAEIDWLRGEVRRLNDLLTQAYEQSRIIPRQSEHVGPPSPPQTQRKSMAEIQTDYAKREQENYIAWQKEEEARLERLRQSNGNH